ncbi:MAG: hypothetical protein ACFFBH_08535 [Promethearchaeota archaeon]
MQDKNYSLLILFLLVVSIFNVISLSTYAYSFEKSKIYSNGYNIPNLNANEIVIITPENKAYISPMSGYYPATLGFECDLEGANPLNCIVEEIGGEVNVLDHIDGHNKVVAINDTSSSDFPYFYNTFEVTQTNGTYEFWVRTTNATGFQGLRLYSGNIIDSNVAVDFLISNGKFRCYDGVWHDITICENNRWYHIEIAFECTAGRYRGLDQYKFKVWINHTEYGEFGFWNNKLSVDRIQFMGGNPGLQTLYIDAIAYSWDVGYKVGDNFDEGLLLSFNTIFTPDWLGYSLDGSINKTILGNTTIVMPNKGHHNIQVFGIDAFGTIYASNLRQFSIGILPEEVPEIPGYSILLLISISLIMISITIKRRLTS